MKSLKKKKKRFDISESGALSDLAFLLIIFFIVIAVFNINRGFLLGLPRKDSAKIVNVEDIIRMQLTSGNELIYQDRPISPTELETVIKERLQLKPNMTFVLKIAPEAPYQDVVSVVEVVRKLEVENFSFSMDETIP